MKEGTLSPEYTQLPLGHPFELYDKTGEIHQKGYALNTRLAVVEALEERGFPINVGVDQERKYYEVFRGEKVNPTTITTFTTTQEGMTAINRVMADPQLRAMNNALTYKGVNLLEGFDTALDELRGSLEAFTWPHKQYIDHLMIEATRHAAIYNSELSREMEGEHLWSQDKSLPLMNPAAITYSKESEKFLNRSRELIETLPGEVQDRYVTHEDVDKVVSAAIERTFDMNTEQH